MALVALCLRAIVTAVPFSTLCFKTFCRTAIGYHLYVRSLGNTKKIQWNKYLIDTGMSQTITCYPLRTLWHHRRCFYARLCIFYPEYENNTVYVSFYWVYASHIRFARCNECIIPLSTGKLYIVLISCNIVYNIIVRHYRCFEINYLWHCMSTICHLRELYMISTSCNILYNIVIRRFRYYITKLIYNIVKVNYRPQFVYYPANEINIIKPMASTSSYKIPS